nr:reverse transcriptase domain-containing protein [Tanacetum cinerariifolium]
ELIQQMANVQYIKNMTEKQLAAMAGKSIFTFDPSIPLNYLFKGLKNKELIIQGEQPRSEHSYWSHVLVPTGDLISYRSGSQEQRRGRSKSPREKGPERRTVFKRLEKGMFHRLGDKEKNVSAHSRGSERKSYYSSRKDTKSCYQSYRSKETETASEKHRHKKEYSRRTEAVSESEGSTGGHWKSKPKKKKSSMDDDLSQPWGEMAASNREQKKSFPLWKQETGQKQNFKRGNFQNEQRMERKQDRFTLLTKTPREILALDKGNFKPLSPMKTLVETRNASKYCEFDGEVGHTTDELISFPTLGEEDGTEGPMMIKAEMGGHCMHHWRDNMASRADIVASKGRPRVRKIRAIPSTAHRLIKFLVAGGIVTFQSSMIIPLEFSMVSEPGVPRSAINQVREEKIQVAIHPKHPEQTITIGSTLREEGWKELCGLLRRHIDVQKKKGQAPKRNKAISKEVKKLVEADIMKEVHYHSWLSNPLMVKKHDDNWRMCVDFMDLNKACPKDGYPLPEIDWKVESLYGYPYKCFLDAYKGYHQIKMAEEDEEKTAFITSQRIFCY